MKKSTTFTATIYVGFRERYTELTRPIGVAYNALQKIANQGGICVSVTPTKFIYKDGNEDGIAVGLINYPRFPETVAGLKIKAIDVAQILMHEFKQSKVSIVFPDETVMLENEPTE